MQDIEKRWVDDARRGDMGFFPELVTAYQNRVYAMAYRFHAEEAEDIAQEIFIAIYRNIARFEGRSKLSTWIYRIATNTAINQLRRHKPVLPLEEDMLSAGTSPPADTDLIAKSEHEEFRRVIEQLSTNYQEIIELYYFQELSYQSIADILQIPVRTVETRLYRARAKLKELLSGREENHA